MTTNVSADELDFVRIDRKLIERAVEAHLHAPPADIEALANRSDDVLVERPAILRPLIACGHHRGGAQPVAHRR